jgi:hypothetical protein
MTVAPQTMMASRRAAQVIKLESMHAEQDPKVTSTEEGRLL